MLNTQDHVQQHILFVHVSSCQGSTFHRDGPDVCSVAAQLPPPYWLLLVPEL
jgi:hypothetical protein